MLLSLSFEQHTEFDNLIAMQNLRISAHKGSNDAYDVSVSLINGSMVKKRHFIKDGIRISCNTEKFVPIVVLGLTSSSSGTS